ncbi:glycosyltransferase family 2 protein [Helicobacter fennelliae]
MFLSILVPTYNRKDELSRNLDSILAQGYSWQNSSNQKRYGKFNELVEIIVQNNASTDGTKEMLDEMSHKILSGGGAHLKVFHNPSNFGLCQNMIEVLKNATGKYILYLTDDDYLLPQSLSKIIDFLQNNTYDFVRLNLITFLEQSIQAYCNILFASYIDTTNATQSQKVSIFCSTHILTGNIFRREKIDMEAMCAVKEWWFPHMSISGRMMDNFAYIPYAYIVHTWENKVYWGDENAHHKRDEYSNVTAGLYKTILGLECVLGMDFIKEAICWYNPHKKLYAFAYDILSTKQKVALWRANTKQALKTWLKKIVFFL